MTQYLFNCRVQWTKHEPIAALQRRRQRPVFRAQVKVSFTEDDRTESFDVHRIQRVSSSQAHFNGSSSLLVHAAETSRKRGGVIRHYEIVRTQELDKRSARNVNQVTLRIDDEKFCVRWTLYC